MRHISCRLAIAAVGASLLMTFFPATAHADDPGNGVMLAQVLGAVGTGGAPCVPSDEDSNIWPTVLATSPVPLTATTITFSGVSLTGSWSDGTVGGTDPFETISVTKGIVACQVGDPITGLTIGGTVATGGGAANAYAGGRIAGTVLSGFDVVAGAVAVTTFDTHFTVAGGSLAGADADEVGVLAVVPCSTVDQVKDLVTGESGLDAPTDAALFAVCNAIAPGKTGAEGAGDVDVVVGAVAPFVTSGPAS